ncbi:serine/threonine protein kinase [Scytonema sp. HK-05]|uniref:protein kinase domain-containing protein n=1 Tax=Scytonema sp. HK-05 TaxID=1137095 RepID=UPI000936D5D9|nr:protein kinase [Scytonema sp. HK-05]OKH57750.1 serine/threonine protein kinase [Scytonema sp. HK-05]BAY48090.1 serine/threonine protein kinase [Scytonema sp. HK-05]
MLGKLLDGRYKVVQVLKAGGFGQTYIAEDTRRPGNPKCVLKLLKPASSDAYCLEVARRLFHSEAEILEQLGNHDQVPRLLAYFEEKEDFFLVQELIVGRPLSTEMQVSQPWTESQVIQMLQDILGVLEFVHSYGVIHRDIKPDNLIRRDKDGKLVLIDFGAVKQMCSQLVASPSQITATVAIGTPGYMPAEQAQGKPRHNSDIYAVGMIAIQAMTGLLPTQFQENQETGEVVWQHQAQVSPVLGAIMQRMVCYHYRDRYQSATEVLQDLQQLTNPLLATQLSIPPTYIYNAAPPSNIPVAASQQPSSVPVYGTTKDSRLPQPPTWLNPTLSVVRFLPFIGAFGLFLFKAATWLVLLGIVLVAFGAGLFFLRSWYPRLGRDYDAIFAVVFCLSGILLLFQESRSYGTQEIPIGQSLLAGAGVFSVAECIRLRGR